MNEELVDPKIFDVLPRLRRLTSRPFEFMTNGSPLDEARLALLNSVKPVHLVVSINSLDAVIRSEVMRELSKKNTVTALACLVNLAERQIPFGVSFVAVPEVPLSDLLDSIRRLDGVGASFVRVNLPGFTRDTPYKIEFDTGSHWTRVVEALTELRSTIKLPLITIPSAFEENHLRKEPLAPRILGTVPGSPAARAGLRPGDIIRRVGYHDIQDRARLQAALLLSRGCAPLMVERDGASVEVVVDFDAPPVYPYVGHSIGKYTFPAGVVMAPCISTRDLDAVTAALREHRTGEFWVVTSPLMEPAARHALAATGEDVERVRLVVARNHFLGGNIQVLDMCTTGDIARSIAEALEGRERPLGVFVPGSGFNRNGRDLAGRHWSEIERWLGIPVHLLTATTQFVF